MTVTSHKPKLTIPISGRDHILGPIDAPVTLVEYGDFECPHCAQAHTVLQYVLQQLGDNVCFAYRHFPLATIHVHAVTAAESAECAGAQDSFWQMHDILFEQQDRLEIDDLLAAAETLELDLEQFSRDLAQHTYEPRVREDFQTGLRSGVNGTPTFFINGQRHNGAYDRESLLTSLLAAAS